MKAILFFALLLVVWSARAQAGDDFPPGWIPLSILDDKTTWSEVREIKAGEIILVEDVSGKGHLSKSVGGKLRHSLFIPIE